MVSPENTKQRQHVSTNLGFLTRGDTVHRSCSSWILRSLEREQLGQELSKRPSREEDQHTMLFRSRTIPPCKFLPQLSVILSIQLYSGYVLFRRRNILLADTPVRAGLTPTVCSSGWTHRYVMFWTVKTASTFGEFVAWWWWWWRAGADSIYFYFRTFVMNDKTRGTIFIQRL